MHLDGCHCLFFFAKQKMEKVGSHDELLCFVCILVELFKNVLFLKLGFFVFRLADFSPYDGHSRIDFIT